MVVTPVVVPLVSSSMLFRDTIVVLWLGINIKISDNQLVGMFATMFLLADLLSRRIKTVLERSLIQLDLAMALQEQSR